MQCVCLIYYKCNLMHMHFALDYLTSLCSFEKNMAFIILKKQNQIHNFGLLQILILTLNSSFDF